MDNEEVMNSIADDNDGFDDDDFGDDILQVCVRVSKSPSTIENEIYLCTQLNLHDTDGLSVF